MCRMSAQISNHRKDSRQKRLKEDGLPLNDEKRGQVGHCCYDTSFRCNFCVMKGQHRQVSLDHHQEASEPRFPKFLEAALELLVHDYKETTLNRLPLPNLKWRVMIQV